MTELMCNEDGIEPIYDSRDDVAIFAGVARALS